jgi:hypothetical protein
LKENVVKVYGFIAVESEELQEFEVFDSEAKAEVAQNDWIASVRDRYLDVPTNGDQAEEWMHEHGNAWWIEEREVA